MPTDAQKTIARHISAVWGRRPRIVEMRAEGTKHVQAFAQLVNFPVEGMVGYATIGLSEPGAPELPTLGPTKYGSVPKALFDVSSYVAAGDRMLRSGEVFENVIGRYCTRSDVGQWLVRAEAPEGFQIPAVQHSGRRVGWVYAWPVTSDELVWHSIGASTMSAAGLHPFDLSRRSLGQVPTSECVGETEAAIRAVFERAQKLAPAT